MDWLEQIRKPNYWLLGLAATLVALHLTYLSKDENSSNLLSLSILVWLGIASSIWDRRDRLKLESDVFSTVLGMTLITLVLLRSSSPAGYHVGLSPFLSGLGLCLMATSIKRLYYFWKELLLLGFIMLYPIFTVLLRALDLSTLTAKFSTFALWATGFNAYRDGVSIFLPTGRVEVYGACSGVDSIILMLCIATIFLLMIPLNPIQQIICLTVAVLIGFAVNGVRVCILAILVAYSQRSAFDYWHGGDGSLVFSTISVFLFGAFCWWAYVRNQTISSDSGDS
jgi:cyanoexosortase A